MLEILLYAIAFISLLIASYTDIKSREVPDWLSYTLIVSALGIRLIFALDTFNFYLIIEGLAGFLIFLALGYLMYYSRQWGGGDSKLLMGMGAVFGASMTAIPWLLVFFIALMFSGAIYGLFWMIALGIKNSKSFVEHFRRQKVRHWLLILITIILIPLSLIDAYLIFAAILPYFIFYTLIAAKAVENSSLYKHTPVGKLTEGDWVAKEVSVKSMYICDPKDLGLTKSQISLLKKYNIKTVLVKEGIPFVPSFLLGLIITLMLRYSVKLFAAVIGNFLNWNLFVP